ncbi:MAG: T9SS type A sorting domain-containing protein, partial [Hymenobacter sp.]
LAVARQVDVYPNPSAGRAIQLLLHGYEGETIALIISDNLGRLIATQHFTPATAQYLTPLALPQGMAAGTYILTLVGSGSPIQKRLVLSE